MRTVQDLATDYLKFFETKTRNDGKEFFTLKDNRPEELQNIVRLAHCDMFPDDYKYSFIREALETIAMSIEQGEQDAIQAIEPSPYTFDQLAWLSSNLTRSSYCDDAVSDYGHSGQGITGDIGMGMWKEMQDTAQIVLNELESILNELAA
jgi:hypothetical protein